MSTMSALANKRAISSVKIMTELGQQHGLSISHCLQNTGITSEQLEDSSALVTGAQELQVIENLAHELPEVRGLGLQAGMRYQLTTFGIWGFAIISSPTVRDAIDVALRFTDLSFVLLKFSYHETAESAEIVMGVEHIPTHLRQFVVERHLAVFMMLAREMMGSEVLAPREIHLTIDELPLPGLADLMPTTHIYLGAEQNRFVLDPTLLARRVPKANAATAAFCLKQCQELLNQRHSASGLSGDIRAYLLENLTDIPPMSEVAAHFFLSQRTLSRRLESEGSSFRELVDDVREGVAAELLETAKLSVESVAERLGYAEPASFIRAFKRWTGVTPAQYRRAG